MLFLFARRQYQYKIFSNGVSHLRHTKMMFMPHKFGPNFYFLCLHLLNQTSKVERESLLKLRECLGNVTWPYIWFWKRYFPIEGLFSLMSGCQGFSFEITGGNSTPPGLAASPDYSRAHRQEPSSPRKELR